jgi:hypothetical protein
MFSQPPPAVTIESSCVGNSAAPMLRRCCLRRSIPPDLQPPFRGRPGMDAGGGIDVRAMGLSATATQGANGLPGGPSSSSGILGVDKPRYDEKTGKRILEDWEFEPTPAHRSLVILLYRETLKGLLEFPSVRKRSLISWCRIAFRRRGKATEKLLVDECIEEARRAVYVITKHNDSKKSREYKYDDMFMPKDTGQDVQTYMEEVYDPAASKASFEQVKDVEPGKEHEHRGGLRGANAGKGYMSQTERELIEKKLMEESQATSYYTHRPPPPPGSSQHADPAGLPKNWDKPVQP